MTVVYDAGNEVKVVITSVGFTVACQCCPPREWGYLPAFVDKVKALADRHARGENIDDLSDEQEA